MDIPALVSCTDHPHIQEKSGIPTILILPSQEPRIVPAIAPDTSVIMTKVIAFKIIFSTWREKSCFYRNTNDMENQPHASYHDKIHASTLCQMPALLEQY